MAMPLNFRGHEKKMSASPQGAQGLMRVSLTGDKHQWQVF